MPTTETTAPAAPRARVYLARELHVGRTYEIRGLGLVQITASDGRGYVRMHWLEDGEVYWVHPTSEWHV